LRPILIQFDTRVSAAIRFRSDNRPFSSKCGFKLRLKPKLSVTLCFGFGLKPVFWFQNKVLNFGFNER